MNKTTNQMSQDPQDNPITVYEMTGKDALAFLNNQVLSELPNHPDNTLFTAICNPKGRIIFTCILNLKPNQVLVAVDSSLGDNFLQYINMRRFRMDFSIEKTAHRLVFDTTPEKPNVAEHTSFTTDSTTPQNAENMWQFMFKTGLPWITQSTVEKFIPQYMNLDQNDIIAFDKGCYPGQEIVARLHFLGKVKKRMRIISYQADGPMTLDQLKQLPNMDAVEALCSPSLYDGVSWRCQAIMKL